MILNVYTVVMDHDIYIYIFFSNLVYSELI